MDNRDNGPGAGLASLKYDPFLVRVGEPGYGAAYPGSDGFREDQPLASDTSVPGARGGEAKLMILPISCCMVTQTILSVVSIALSFGESGHRDGYENGNLNSKEQDSGCEALFYWMIVQAGLDLVITCMTCLFLVSPLKTEPVGVHGCCATVRLCTLAAGFHILYFAGLKRDLCNGFLVVWSTIIVWIGVGVMLLAGCFLTCMLLGAVGQGRYPVPQKSLSRKPAAMPVPYQTQFNR